MEPTKHQLMQHLHTVRAMGLAKQGTLAFCQHPRRVLAYLRDSDQWIWRCADPACKRVVSAPVEMDELAGLGPATIARVVEIGVHHRDDDTCSVDGCGGRSIEVHHWAPRSVFGAACEHWPTDPLCLAHHREWHGRLHVVAAQTG